MFGTVHAPLIHPLIAAKQFVTADHIGQGRFGLNIVCGWNEGEFDMFGATMREHEARYDYAQEWFDTIRLAWSAAEDCDFTVPAAILPADHLMARVGILAGSSVGQVRFSVFAVADNGTATPLTPVVANGISQPSQALDVDLSRAAGARTVRLRVDADGSSAQDWAVWVEPHVIGRP